MESLINLTNHYERGADYVFEFADDATLDYTENEYGARQKLMFFVWVPIKETPKKISIWLKIGDSRMLKANTEVNFLAGKLLEDSLRLEWLNEIHNKLNDQCGHDGYAWEVIMNHNVNRLFLRRPKCPMVLDVNDSACTRVHDVRCALDNAGARSWRDNTTKVNDSK